MSTKTLSPRSVADYSVWQVTGRLILLAGILMASSYCVLISVSAIAKAFH